MVWFRRLLYLFLGLFLGFTLLLVCAAAFMSTADYKRALAWIANSVFDSDLVIDGALSVRLSDSLVVNVGDIKLDAHDDSYHFSSHTIEADIQLQPLLSGTLWLNDLVVSQLFLKVNETDSQTLELQDLALPPVIITRADVEGLLVEYQEMPPGSLHRFSLNELQLDDVNDSGPITIQANGLYEGNRFDVRGTLPSTDDLLDQVRPKPVELVITGEQGHAKIAGTIIDPVNGKGLDLNLDLETKATTLLLELLGDDIPEVGELHASATLRGDYDNPRLENIGARLKRGEVVDFSASGSVDDIYTGKGLNLHFKGHTEQPDVASWLLFRKLGQLNSLILNGVVQKKEGHFYLADLNAAASTRKGLSVTAQGNAELYHADHLFLNSDSGINATFSAPSTAAVNLLNIADVPELGAVAGSFKLLVSTDAIGLYNANLSIGDKGSSTARLQGRIRNIPLLDEAGATGIDLQLSVQSPDVAKLAGKLDYALPAIGAGKASARLVGNLDNLKMKQVYIQAGDDADLRVTAKGDIDRLVLGKTVKLDHALLDVDASTRDLSKLSRLTGIDLPSRMPARMSTTVTLNKSELLFKHLQINIGRPEQPVIRVQGKVTTQLDKGSSIFVSYSVAVADLVAAYTDSIPGYLGRLQGKAEISDIDGSWGIEKFNLDSSQTSLYQVNIHGGYDDLKNSDLVNIRINLEVNDPATLGNALGINLSGLKPYRHDGRLTSQQDKIVYHGNMSIGKTAGITIIHGSTVAEKPFFNGTLSIPHMDLTDFGFQLEREVEAETFAKPEPSGKGHLFSRKPLNPGFLNNFGLDLRIKIDEIASYGKTSIDSFVGRATLQGGELKLDPLRFVYAGGTLDARLALQASEPPAIALNVIADDLVLGPALAQMQNLTSIEGRANVNLDVTSKGVSAHELASNLDGTINIEYENAKIPVALIQFLSFDVLGWVISNTVARQKHLDLNCIVAQFSADAGEIKSRLLVADGPNMALGGRLDMNLHDETIDAVLLPKKKGRLFSSVTPVRLTGPIRDPDVEAIPAKAAIRELGVLSLSPTIYLSTRLLEKIWSAVKTGGDVGEGCTNIEKLTDEAEQARKKAQARPAPGFNDAQLD